MFKPRPENFAGYKQLITAVMVQAAVDYRDLDERGIDEMTVDDYKIGKAEIEEFLLGDWCFNLLEGIGGNLTGKTLLANLKMSVSIE